MSTTDDVLRNAEQYASSFDKADLPMPPGRKLAVVACMDARLDVYRILGLGDNTIDTYVDAGLQFPGGNAVNVAVMARRLGAETSYLGCWGDDEGGRLLEDALTAERVDLSHVRRIAGGLARFSPVTPRA